MQHAVVNLTLARNSLKPDVIKKYWYDVLSPLDRDHDDNNICLSVLKLQQDTGLVNTSNVLKSFDEVIQWTKEHQNSVTKQTKTTFFCELGQ